MRLTGALLITLSGCGAGLYSVYREKRRVGTLDEMCRCMEKVRVNLRTTRADLDRVLEEAFCESSGEQLLSHPLMRSFLEGLGTGPLEQQLEHCDAHIEAAVALRGRARDEQAKNSRVALTLYSLGGLAAAILLY